MNRSSEWAPRTTPGDGAAVLDILPPLQEWSQQIVGHGWFPPDPYKRASG